MKEHENERADGSNYRGPGDHISEETSVGTRNGSWTNFLLVD